MDAHASYTQENVAELTICLLSGIDGRGINVTGLSFGDDALRDQKNAGALFQNCCFSNTSLELAELTNCEFNGCKFTLLRLTDTTRVSQVILQGCTVDALVLTERNREVWSPAEIRQQLQHAGVVFRDNVQSPPQQSLAAEPDPEIVDVEKLIRYFMRSTHMSESVIRMKLSGRGQSFIDETLPQLEKCGAFVEIQNLGAGDQRRFRLGVAAQTINDAMAAANGDFGQFLAQFN